MSRLRGRSPNREALESCPEDSGAAFQPGHFGAAKACPRLIALSLALVTLLVYLPVVSHGFSIFDDDDYVTQNPVVRNGLTWAGVKWAFTTWHSSNWHPLTWLSHMTDCSLFGLNAGAHHSVNLLIHAANVVLLFGLLLRLTNALWPAAFVAALFAWHPLHVESVAWVAERKDVLSTCFGLLSLLSYARYAQRRSRGESRESRAGKDALTLDYALALVCFALGLMAKPMLVTLPFVMLLLDYWPIQRFNRSTIQRLIFEKWPFFALTVASCVVTYLAQHQGGMVASLEEMPPGYRLNNVLLAYIRYLGKIVWPVNLAIFYPLPKIIPLASVLAAAVVLAAISTLVWFGRRRGPYGLVGWLWFLGTLLPVIGLVQVGQAAMADRYTYFPSVGLFIAVTFAAGDWAHRRQRSAIAVTAVAVMVLGACVVLTENQLRCWGDDERLFSHAISVTRDNEPAHLCLARVDELKGRPDAAVAEYRLALKLNPRRVKTYNSLAMVLAGAGRTNEALAELQVALRWFPADAPTHDSCANLLADAGRTGEALGEFREAVRLDPNNATLQNNLGALLLELGRFDEAMEHFAAAAQADPADWRARYLTGKALLEQGRDGEAIPHFRQALQVDPDNVNVLIPLARVLAADENSKFRDGRDALELASRANDLDRRSSARCVGCPGDGLRRTRPFRRRSSQRSKGARSSPRPAKIAEPLRQRLQLYRNRQPWRESFPGHQPGAENISLNRAAEPGRFPPGMVTISGLAPRIKSPTKEPDVPPAWPKPEPRKPGIPPGRLRCGFPRPGTSARRRPVRASSPCCSRWSRCWFTCR